MTGSPRCDTLIIGGGLAGAIAATLLARAGAQVTLVEREASPQHKVCGEFLSAEALDLLGLAGLDPAALGAVPIRNVRLCSAGQVTTAKLPFPALSLTRRRLDDALLHAAQTAGATVLRGFTAESLTHDPRGWSARFNDGSTITAGQAILATGKHDLRGFARPRGPQGDLVALKMYWQLTPAQTAALAGYVELLLYPGGYAGLQPVEDGTANLCALMQRSTLARLGGGWESLLAHIRQSSPHARDRLANADPLLPKPLAVAAIPYGFVRSKPAGDQLWAVGDQAAVIPSFTGDGMSIALYTGVHAAGSILAGHSSARFQRQLHAELHRQVTLATALSRGLLQPWARPLMVATARLWPQGLRTIARATRLPSRSLLPVTSGPTPTPITCP